MNEQELKAKLAEQIVNGTQHDVELAEQKIRILREAQLVSFDERQAYPMIEAWPRD